MGGLEKWKGPTLLCDTKEACVAIGVESGERAGRQLLHGCLYEKWDDMPHEWGAIKDI